MARLLLGDRHSTTPQYKGSPPLWVATSCTGLAARAGGHRSARRTPPPTKAYNTLAMESEQVASRPLAAHAPGEFPRAHTLLSPGPPVRPAEALPPPDTAVSDPAYQAALAYLYGLSAVPRSPEAIRADWPRKLVRMRRLLALWGNPQEAYPTVLIAGTKGKGSTAAMLAAILQAAGWRVGRYTQPHLVSYRERIWANGTFIPCAAVAALATEVRPLVEESQRRWPLLGTYTTFEVGTALALTYFARVGVDLAVVEVGVGGAHDATNVLDPIASVITAISEDHLATLGPTLADVAREKAGVLRPGRPAFSARQPADAARVLHAVAASVGARLQWVGREWIWEPREPLAQGGRFAVRGPAVAYDQLTLPLLGWHQRENATLAIATAQALASVGRPVPEAAVARGLATLCWPGRIQVFPGPPPLVVDVAHNVESAERLRETLAECFPGRPIVLVLGCSADKDIAGIAARLAPLARVVIATRAQHPRAAPPAVIAAAARAAGAQVAEAPTTAQALARAWACCESTGLVVVAGSLFLAGEALEQLLDRLSPPPVLT